jgi:hypothetical protein
MVIGAAEAPTIGNPGMLEKRASCSRPPASRPDRMADGAGGYSARSSPSKRARIFTASFAVSGEP